MVVWGRGGEGDDILVYYYVDDNARAAAHGARLTRERSDSLVPCGCVTSVIMFYLRTTMYMILKVVQHSSLNDWIKNDYSVSALQVKPSFPLLSRSALQGACLSPVRVARVKRYLPLSPGD